MATILTDQTVDLLMDDQGGIQDFIPQGKATGPLTALRSTLLSTPMEFGAIGDGVVDDTSALLLWAASGRKLKGWGGRKYGIKASITLEADTNLVSFGPHEGLQVLAGFVGDAVLTNTPGSFVEIPAPEIVAMEGDNFLQFSASPNVVPGEILCIYDSADYSLSSYRSSYRKGEFVRVASMPLGSGPYTVNIGNNLYDTYEPSATLKLYKFAPDRTTFSGVFSISGEPTTYRVQITASQGTNIALSALDQVGHSCILIQRSVDFTVGGATRLHNDGNNTGTDYGLVFSNCQWGRVQPGMIAHARRHAVATGGGNEVGSVPCRDIISGAVLTNNPESLTTSADFHGNVEDCHYVNCTARGVSLSGKNNSFTGGTLTPVVWPAGVFFAYVSEWRGGFQKLDGVTLLGARDHTTGRGIFDAQGTSGVIQDCHLIFTNCRVNFVGATAPNTRLVRVVNNAKSYAFSVTIRDVDINIADGGRLFTALDLSAINGGTVNPKSKIEIDRVSGLGDGCSLMVATGAVTRYHDVAKLRLQRQTGKIAMTTIAGQSHIPAGVTIPNGYPKAPHGLIGVSGPGGATIDAAITNATPSTHWYSLSGSTARPMLRTGVAVAAGLSFDLHWSAELREF